MPKVHGRRSSHDVVSLLFLAALASDPLVLSLFRSVVHFVIGIGTSSLMAVFMRDLTTVDAVALSAM